MKYGVEIEAEGGTRSQVHDELRGREIYNRSTGEYSFTEGSNPLATVTTDGSLKASGVEVKPTRGLFPAEFTPWVGSVTTAMRDAGFSSNSRCGLHIHVDRNSMPEWALEDFTLALSCWSYVGAQGAVDTKLFHTNASRLSSQYSRAADLTMLMRASLEGACAAFSNHYLAVSWSEHHQTIEVRMARGSMSAPTIDRVWSAIRCTLGAVRSKAVRAELATLRADAVTSQDAMGAIVYDADAQFSRYRSSEITYGEYESAYCANSRQRMAAANVLRPSVCAVGMALDAYVRKAMRDRATTKARNARIAKRSPSVARVVVPTAAALTPFIDYSSPHYHSLLSGSAGN